jgi:hypothetical protein
MFPSKKSVFSVVMAYSVIAILDKYGKPMYELLRKLAVRTWTRFKPFARKK